jgi:hypothetical protein
MGREEAQMSVEPDKSAAIPVPDPPPVTWTMAFPWVAM